MPLRSGKSKKNTGLNIGILIGEGFPSKQALAIALSKSSKRKKKKGKKKDS